MITGFIRSYGKHAITIQTSDKKQYYGIYTNIINIDDVHIRLNLPVEFDIDNTNHSGKTPHGKRFYAKNINLCTTLMI
jgi:hypothetical protein